MTTHAQIRALRRKIFWAKLDQRFLKLSIYLEEHWPATRPFVRRMRFVDELILKKYSS